LIEISGLEILVGTIFSFLTLLENLARSSWKVKHKNSMEKALGPHYNNFRGCLYFCITARWSRGTS